MKTHIEAEIEDLETTAQSPWVERHFRETTCKLTESEQISNSTQPETKTTVDVFAVISNRSTSEKGIVKVASYSASDLYRYAQAPILDFNAEIRNLSEKLRDISKTAEDNIEYEVETVYFWDKI